MKKGVEKAAVKAVSWIVAAFGAAAFISLCVGIIRWGFGL